MGVVSAAIVYKARAFALYCVASFITLYLLQGRASVLFLFLVMGAYAVHYSTNMLRRHRQIGELALICVCLGILFLVLSFGDTARKDEMKSIFLYTDENRGEADSPAEMSFGPMPGTRSCPRR